MNIEDILQENARRMAARPTDYDPESGRGCLGERKEVCLPGGGRALVPVTMTEDPEYRGARMKLAAWRQLRCRHDFEYWCVSCATIRDKRSGQDIRLRLNAPQRRVAGVLESDRLAGRPIRMILLKARQWGGSTLVQLYMAWIQACHRRNWHSLICAHVKDTASVIRGMYTKLLAEYPEALWEGEDRPEFKPYERALNVRILTGRGCRVTIGSAEKQEAIRGSDYAMAHLSETAFWPETQKRSPADFIRGVAGSVPMEPYSLVVMESTANGVGNYFHSEWVRCRNGEGDKQAVFVPWYEIEIYRLEPPNPEELAGSLDSYEQGLWARGLCLDQIYWYRCKRKEYPSTHQMMAEFPTTDIEAFVNTGAGVFETEAVERLRAGCRPGKAWHVPLRGHSDAVTAAEMWEEPQDEEHYVVAVDVGGRSYKADWSVIAVLKRPSWGRPAEVVAQWRGHADHDILADTAMSMARYYGEALLVVESNTLESEAESGNLFILNRIARDYRNTYHRRAYDTDSGTETMRVGFHTNRATKALIVNTLIAYVREGAYIERDAHAADELTTYERKPSGAYGAKRGYHDDILMTRAIGLQVMEDTRSLHSSASQREMWDSSEPW